jgi:hypothetical protein
MQTHVDRNAVAAGIAAALLLIAPGARADHEDRREDTRARHAHERPLQHHHGPRWLRPDRHAQERISYHDSRRYRTAYHHGPRVIVHAPYYCVACNARFHQEARFHRHLREQHRLMRHIRWHLVRWYGSWAYFG